MGETFALCLEAHEVHKLLKHLDEEVVKMSPVWMFDVRDKLKELTALVSLYAQDIGKEK